MFSSYFYGALVEVPAWGTPLIMHKFGRKKPLVATYLVSGVAGITYAFIPQSL